VKFTEKEKLVLQATLLDGFSRGDQSQFVVFCERAGLDPFRKQVYAQNRGGKMTIVTSIDGLRAIAQRSGEYRGQTTPAWLDAKGQWHEVWMHSGMPVACKVGVHREGFVEPLYAIATMNEHGGVGPMWKKMPAHMLSIRAESLALRKGFSNELGGLLSDGEVDDHPIENASSTSEPPAQSKADEIKQKIAKKDTPAPEPEVPEDPIDAAWLNDSLETIGSSLGELRAVMSRAKNPVDNIALFAPPEYWPNEWRPRIEKWLEVRASDMTKED